VFYYVCLLLLVLACLLVIFCAQSSAVILGNDQIWRIDPTGQFWKCHAVALGRDADRAEADLYRRIMERLSSNGDDDDDDVAAFLKNSTVDEVVALACECMESVLWPMKKTPNPAAGNAIHWKAVILEYGPDVSKPNRLIRRGAFLPPKIAEI
jgi:hypothetical protein